MTILERLGQLQQEYFDKFGKLYEAIEVLGDTAYSLMLHHLQEQYEKEYKRLMRKAALENCATDYALNVKESYLIPQRCGFFWRKHNQAASLIIREVSAEVIQSFNKRTEALERLEAALMQAEESTRLDDVESQDKPQEGYEQETDTQSEPEQETAPEAQTEATEGETQPEEAPEQDTAASIPLIAEKKAIELQPENEQSESQAGEIAAGGQLADLTQFRTPDGEQVAEM